MILLKFTTQIKGTSTVTGHKDWITIDSLQLGVGYRSVSAQGVTFTLRYDAEVRSGYLGHQLSARAMWAF